MGALESGYSLHRLRAVNPIGDQSALLPRGSGDDLKHGLQTADGLAEKGFRWSHLGASCLTGSCCPARRFFPGNWVMVLVVA